MFNLYIYAHKNNLNSLLGPIKNRRAACVNTVEKKTKQMKDSAFDEILIFACTVLDAENRNISEKKKEFSRQGLKS